MTQDAIDNVNTLMSEGATIVTIGIGPEEFTNLRNLASDNFSFVLNDFKNPDARSNMSAIIGSALASICAVDYIPTTTASTTTPRPTTTPTSTIPPTTSYTCPNGGPYIQQSIAVVYNMIDAYGGLSNSTASQITPIIGSLLFDDSSYFIPNATQVLLRPYPDDSQDAFYTFNPTFHDLINKDVLNRTTYYFLQMYSSINVSSHIDDGLAL